MFARLFGVILAVLLAGCGGSDATERDPYSLAPNVTFSQECHKQSGNGVCIRNMDATYPLTDALVEDIGKAWDDVQECVGMATNPPTIEYHDHRYIIGGNGYFFWYRDNYIVAYSFDFSRKLRTTKHEFVHYLLWVNGINDLDQHINHTYTYFDDCAPNQGSARS